MGRSKIPIRLRTYRTLAISERQRKRLFRMTLRDGTMRDNFDKDVASGWDSLAVVAYRNGEMVGWAILYGRARMEINVFVVPKHRRRGVGRMLVDKCHKHRGYHMEAKFYIYAWDYRSRAFYNRVLA